MSSVTSALQGWPGLFQHHVLRAQVCTALAPCSPLEVCSGTVLCRYVVRLDAGNTHLRGGAVGAFGLVRAAAAADILQVGRG